MNRNLPMVTDSLKAIPIQITMGEHCNSQQQSIFDEDFDEEIDLVLVSN